MTLVDKIRDLCKSKKMTIAELERKLDFSQGSVRKWDRQAPSSLKLKKVADFFGITTDYLLGRTDAPFTSASPKDESEEMAMLLFRKSTENMTEKQKKKFTSSLSNLMEAARDIVEDDDNFK